LFKKDEPHLIKPLLYVFRVLLTGIYLMQTGEIEANLSNLNQHFQLTYLDQLIDIKKNEREKTILNNPDIAFYEKEYERLVYQLEEEVGKTHLPIEPTVKKELNDLLIRLRLTNSPSFEQIINSIH
jgi:predicted nucleotidyltransferase